MLGYGILVVRAVLIFEAEVFRFATLEFLREKYAGEFQAQQERQISPGREKKAAGRSSLRSFCG